MYVLAQDSTVDAPDVDYAFGFTSITDSTTAVITSSDSSRPPAAAFKAGDTIVASGLTGANAAVYNTTYTVTTVTETATVLTINTSTDTSAATGNKLGFDQPADPLAFTDDDVTEDSERILPADRCIWHILPSTDADTKGGYRVSDVVFYDGNSTDPSAQTGDFRLGYLGKSGRFVPISN